MKQAPFKSAPPARFVIKRSASKYFSVWNPLLLTIYWETNLEILWQNINENMDNLYTHAFTVNAKQCLIANATMGGFLVLTLPSNQKEIG